MGRVISLVGVRGVLCLNILDAHLTLSQQTHMYMGIYTKNNVRL